MKKVIFVPNTEGLVLESQSLSETTNISKPLVQYHKTLESYKTQDQIAEESDCNL